MPIASIAESTHDSIPAQLPPDPPCSSSDCTMRRKSYPRSELSPPEGVFGNVEKTAPAPHSKPVVTNSLRFNCLFNENTT